MKRIHIANSEKGAVKCAVEALARGDYHARIADWGGVSRRVYFRGPDEAIFNVEEIKGSGKWRARIIVKDGSPHLKSARRRR
jgi:hypothetical protein